MPRRFLLPGAGLMILSALALRPVGASANDLSGAQVYQQRCARCHGTDGEGTAKDYPRPLAGKRTVPQLARYIAKNMPDDDPGTVAQADADKLAAYIFGAFYSPAAQAKRKPPRIELARLTIRQYRNAAMDLLADFGPAPPIVRDGAGTGLTGAYFKGKFRGSRNGKPVFTRLDPAVNADLSSGSADAKKLDSPEFTVRWEGSLLAPETGAYEFLLRTDQSGRLFLNDAKRPLIDASVKSGNDTEYRGALYLVAGHLYPVRVEFFRSSLGVVKNDKGKPKPWQASLSLLWKRPGRAAEVIAQRHLFPEKSTPLMALSTPFPPDDRTAGYERGTSVSKAFVEASTEAAIEVATYISAHLNDLAGTQAKAADRTERIRAFCLRFAELAFRRPLTPGQKRLYIDHQFKAAPDADTAVKRVVLLTLKSPWFLYRELEPSGDKAWAAYDVASRLSFALWDSLPDAALRKAAADGKLKTAEQIAAQAERMLNDPRCHAKMRDFFFYWLKVERAGELSKDKSAYPGFNPAAGSDLRTSLELFIDDIMWSETSDFRRLLLDDDLYVNGRLARFYGVALPPEAPFQKVAFRPNERSGVLTHPYLMATFAYPKDSSPIHRGVFLARNVLGLPLRPPNEAFVPLPAEMHPDLTNRQRVALQTQAHACQMCHSIINPLGFSFERYDAIGRLRDKDNGKPIDESGAYLTRDGKLLHFHDARQLAEFLANSPEVHESFVAQFFHHLVRQPIGAYGPYQLANLRKFFENHGCNMRLLAKEIVVRSAAKP